MVFALDSSGKTASVCLRRNGQTLHESLLDAGLTHSETLLPLVQKALAACGLTAGEVELWAVTAGPGSFTGLRIGLSLAKGLALPFGTPLAPVSTLEAMARASGRQGLVLASLNARRGEVYWAAFRLQNGCTRLTPDAAAPASEAQAFLKTQAETVFMVGDGTELCYNNTNCNVGLRADGSPLLVAAGAALSAEAALQRGHTVSAASACPVYLRLSQAERERLEKTARESAR